MFAKQKQSRKQLQLIPQTLEQLHTWIYLTHQRNDIRKVERSTWQRLYDFPPHETSLVPVCVCVWETCLVHSCRQRQERRDSRVTEFHTHTHTHTIHDPRFWGCSWWKCLCIPRSKATDVPATQIRKHLHVETLPRQSLIVVYPNALLAVLRPTGFRNPARR